MPRPTSETNPQQHHGDGESSIHHLKAELTRQKKLAEKLREEVEERNKEKRQVRERAKSSNGQLVLRTGMPVLFLLVHHLDNCANIEKRGSLAIIPCDIMVFFLIPYPMPIAANH